MILFHKIQARENAEQSLIIHFVKTSKQMDMCRLKMKDNIERRE